MPDDLYTRDALAWAEQQSGLLRRLAGGARINRAIDLPHVIDEVRDVDLSELRDCESLLRQAITHLLTLHAWPASRAAAHWLAESGTFLDDAARRFTLSMRPRVDVGTLYASSLRRVRRRLRRRPPAPVAGSLSVHPRPADRRRSRTCGPRWLALPGRQAPPVAIRRPCGCRRRRPSRRRGAGPPRAAG